MANNLFITATDAKSGRSVISLGLMEMLHRSIRRVGYFRPLLKDSSVQGTRDTRIQLIASYFHLDIPYEQMYGFTISDANEMVSKGREGEVLDTIIRKYRALEDLFDFVLCEGTDFESASAAFEFDINAEISKNLGCPVLLVAKADQKTKQEILQSTELAIESLTEKGCRTIGTIFNRTDPKDAEGLVSALKQSEAGAHQLIYAIPEETTLGKPTVGEIVKILDAEVLWGEAHLNHHVHNITVAAMQIRNFLPRIERGSLIITPGDRADIIVASLAAVASSLTEHIAGILLTGGLKPEEPVWELIQGFSPLLPIAVVRDNTYPTAAIVDKMHATIEPGDERKIIRALAVFEKNVNLRALSERVISTRTTVVTPKMFEYDVIQRARSYRCHIVLPEAEDERILRAAEILVHREVADITLLGNKKAVTARIRQIGLRLEAAAVIDPTQSERLDDYARTYLELRKHKGVTLEIARDIMTDASYFGTMMVYKGHADGMVSGAAHSTADTIRPAFEIIRTEQGVTLVSSVLFMCLTERVLVYGDCAINPNPDAHQLAEIALSAARTAKTFGIEPVVAMLSYSTGVSGKGADVDKVRKATAIANEMSQRTFPGLKIEGPIQYDAAVDPGVARSKMPESDVAGRATVFVFPDLNTGNNTYKAVQRSAGAVAVGPVLQGLKYPVNDLSRGCSVVDIVNTVAITAVQAQEKKGRS